jgi:hypothetical protein
MFETFALAFSTQIVLVFTGFSLFQIIFPKNKLRFLTFVPYAWCLGVLFLYLVGGILVRIHFLKGSWHLVVLLIAFLFVFVGYHIREKAAPLKESLQSNRFFFKWYEWIVLALILVKIAIVLWLQMANPVIDSDATLPFLWIGLAKVIHYHGFLPSEVPQCFYVYASILPAWISMFLPRWFDNLTSLPWFFCYLSMVGIGFAGCYQITLNRSASLICAYFVSAVPIVIAHVIRPGYSDVIMSNFFLAGVTALGVMFIKNTQKSEKRLWVSMILMAACGCVLTKHEGLIWALWMGTVWFLYDLYFRRDVCWNKILKIFFAVSLAAYILYFFGSDFIRAYIPMEPSRFEQLFDKQFDIRAIYAFGWAVFEAGSFHFLWWLFWLMAFFVWTRKTADEYKVLTFLMTLPFILFFYYACFTENIQYTIIHTNVSRVLLQIIGLLVPLYAVCVKEFILPILEKKQ